MKCIQKSLGSLAPNYPIENFCIPKQTLFIDIETTGLYAKSSSLYLIGCIYYNQENEANCCWHSIQWFATNYEDEENILRAFAEFEGIDIYRRIAPYKSFLKLPDCKQKTIESFLSTDREDTYSGGELIDIYHDYVLTHDEEKEHFLLLHNEEDIKGMLEVVAALNIPDLFHKPVKVVKVQANYYNDIHQKRYPEIVMNLKLPCYLPTEISYGTNNCYFIGNGQEGKLRVPIYEEEMKYFYSNYKDYYYLPNEDIAIHKSVASFVDKAYREQAHASNCYTKKTSSYLPQWDVVFTPFFKRDYKAKELFFELTDEFKTKREDFNRYAQHILQMMAASKE